MPVVACPKCPTRLKIPDGVSGNTKCPKCGTVFPVNGTGTSPAVSGTSAAPWWKNTAEPTSTTSAPKQPAAPPPAPKSAAPKPPAAPPPSPKSAIQKPASAPPPASKSTIQKSAAAQKALEPDFEVVGETKKRVVVEIDDEDEKPRKKQKRDYDDDDDDDRPRKKKRRREDDDEDWEARPSKDSRFANGKTGALLMSISFWLNLGAYGLIALYAIILWFMVLVATNAPRSFFDGGGGRGGGSSDDGSWVKILVVLPGLIGLGAWIVGTVGCAFSIAGPARARGMAITATVFAGVHLLFLGITFSNVLDGMGFSRLGRDDSSFAWIIMTSTLPALDSFLPLAIYGSRALQESKYIFALLAAICEVLRLVFMLLTLKELSGAARDRYAAAKAGFGLTLVIILVSSVAALVLFMVVLLAEGKFKSPETYLHLVLITFLLTYLAYAFMMLAPAMAALQTKDACDRRT